MKRISAFLLSLLMVFAMIPAAASAASYRYATEPVMFRTGPSTRYAIITELQTGDRVEFLGTSGNWSRVKWNGLTGYVFTKYLTSSAPASFSVPDAAAGRFATATGNGINVRSGPGTSYKKLGTVTKGETVPVVGTNGDWLKIDWDSGNAYVHSRYFTLSQMQAGSSAGEALARSGYFKTNASIFLGTFIDSSDVLNIRVSKGANISKINRELKTLLSGAAGSYRVVSSSLPSYVNEEYIKDLLDTIGQRYERLSASNKKRCDYNAAYYDVSKDQFIVEIIDLNNTKKQYFKKLISNWSYFTFESGDSLAIPMVEEVR